MEKVNSCNQVTKKCVLAKKAVKALDGLNFDIYRGVNLLMRLQAERNLTYLMISHDLTMVRHISDHIAVMYLGVIVELSDAETLYENPLHPYTKALFSAIPQAEPESDWLSRRVPLPGEVPNPLNPPSGCKFCERCSYVMERCRREAPQLREQEQGHFVACWGSVK